MAILLSKTIYTPLFVVFALLLVTETSSQSQSQFRIRKLRMGENGAFPHTHMYIHNYLGGGLKATVSAWNSVKNFHTVTLADGQTDEFGFNPSVLPQFTDVQANVTWDKGHLNNEFVYDWSRDHNRCGKFCHWNITTEGLFGINKNGQADVHFFWKS